MITLYLPHPTSLQLNSGSPYTMNTNMTPLHLQFTVIMHKGPRNLDATSFYLYHRKSVAEVITTSYFIDVIIVGVAFCVVFTQVIPV